jgi:ribosomal protein S18 acetylase RimI-like enzyme
MRFLRYQDDIIKTIEELSPPDDLDENLRYHAKSVMRFYKKITKDINYGYIIGLLENEENQIVFYNLNTDTLFDFDSCASSIIYNIVKKNNRLTCYILVLNTTPKYRNNGYATKLLNEFAEDIKNKYPEFTDIRFVLSATDESFTFYEKNKFVLLEDDLTAHPILSKYEKYDKRKLYYIFERIL